jgi:hypothetical protein
LAAVLRTAFPLLLVSPFVPSPEESVAAAFLFPAAGAFGFLAAGFAAGLPPSVALLLAAGFLLAAGLLLAAAAGSSSSSVADAAAAFLLAALGLGFSTDSGPAASSAESFAACLAVLTGAFLAADVFLGAAVLAGFAGSSGSFCSSELFSFYEEKKILFTIRKIPVYMTNINLDPIRLLAQNGYRLQGSMTL